MFKNKIVEFCVRLAVFLGVGLAWAGLPDLAQTVRNTPLWPLTPVHLVWLLLAADMLFQLCFGQRGGMGANKLFGRHYRPAEGEADPRELVGQVAAMNAGARGVMLFWLALAVLWAALYFGGVIGQSEVLLITALYYIADSFCMVFWCPLQQLFMKCRCCANCRVYGWGYFLVCGLLVLVPGFFTRSLALLSLVLLVRWELVYLRHPERFWVGTNAALRCSACASRQCERKRQLHRGARGLHIR